MAYSPGLRNGDDDHIDVTSFPRTTSTRAIQVEIVADTTQFVKAMKKAEIAVTCSWWRRTLLRLSLWRLERK